MSHRHWHGGKPSAPTLAMRCRQDAMLSPSRRSLIAAQPDLLVSSAWHNIFPTWRGSPHRPPPACACANFTPRMWTRCTNASPTPNGMTALARTPVLPETILVGKLSAHMRRPRPRSATPAVRRLRPSALRKNFDGGIQGHGTGLRGKPP